MSKHRLTAERLRELLHYEPTTGLFTRLVRTSSKAQKGGIAGTLNGKGYLQIGIDEKLYLAHRLAWLYMTGEHPADQIDHVNGIRTDNCWRNLRPASHNENMWNAKKRKDNTSGFKGVCFDKQASKWQASIYLNGARYHLGRFDTPEQASAYYEGAAALAFGHFKRKTTTTTTEEFFA